MVSLTELFDENQRLRIAIVTLRAAIEHIRDDRTFEREPYPETYSRAIAAADAALRSGKPSKPAL